MSYPIRPDTPQQSPGPNPRERSKRPLVDDTCNLDSKRRCTKDQPPVSTTPTVALPIAHQYLHHLLTVCVFFALALYATPGWNKTSKTSNIPYFDDAVVLGTRSQTPENELPPAEPSTQASARGSIKSGRSRSYSGSTPEASTPQSLTPKGSPPKWPNGDFPADPNGTASLATSRRISRKGSEHLGAEEEDEDSEIEEEGEDSKTEEEEEHSKTEEEDEHSDTEEEDIHPWDQEEIDNPLTEEDVRVALDENDGKTTLSTSCDGLRLMLHQQSDRIPFAFHLPLIEDLLQVMSRSPATKRSQGLSGAPRARLTAALCTKFSGPKGCCDVTINIVSALAESFADAIRSVEPNAHGSGMEMASILESRERR